MTYINLLLAAIILWVIGWLVWGYFNSTEYQYNKRMCAVYGYKEDCKTLLPAEERLK